MMQSRVRTMANSLFSSKGEPGLSPVHVGIVLSLVAGFSDLAVDVLSGQTKDVPLGPILMSLAVTVGFFFMLFTILWYGGISRIGRHLDLKPMPLAISFGVFIASAFFLFLMNGLITFSPSRADMIKLITLILVSAVFSFLSYFVIRAISEMPGYRNRASALAMSVPFILGEYAVVTGISQSSFRAGIVFLVSAVPTVFLFLRQNRSTAIRLVNAVFLFIFASAPLSVLMTPGHAAARYGSFQLADHKINRVILITIDTLRADYVSADDSRAATTPSIDGFAQDGILFTRAISPAPWTLPALSSIMTGLSPDVHMTKTATAMLPDKVHTIAEYMSYGGYYTGAIVYNPYLKLSHGMSQGFLDYDVYPKSLIGNSFGAAVLKKTFPRRFRQSVSTSEITDAAVSWLSKNKQGDFFLWIHYLDPHMPYGPPAAFLPKGKAPSSIGTKFDRSGDIQAGRFTPSQAERQWIRGLYDGEVLYVDRNIGRLMATLKQLKIYDDSLILLTADHGEEFWEHNGFEHAHTVYNELLHVPMIIKLPAPSAKGRIETVVQTHSIVPTILDLCGIKFDRTRLSASSLAPLLTKDHGKYEERPVVSSGILNFEDREALTFQGMKYIHYAVSSHEELYDLNRDPKEQYNIANVNPALIQKARETLKQYHAKAQELRDYYQIEKAPEIKLDQKTIQELKSLGYVR